MAAIAPSPTGTASCMYRPRRFTVRSASAKDSVPAATCAEYSPRLWPAANAGAIPRETTSLATAVLMARIAGCVFSVSISRSSGPSKQSVLRGSPSASSASAKVSRQTGNAPASARPMPTFWAPCPGKRKAIMWRFEASRRKASRRARPMRDLSDAAREAATQILIHGSHRHGDGVGDRFRRGSAVADDAETVEADERRAAVLGVVDPAPEPPERLA